MTLMQSSIEKMPSRYSSGKKYLWNVSFRKEGKRRGRWTISKTAFVHDEQTLHLLRLICCNPWTDKPSTLSLIDAVKISSLEAERDELADPYLNDDDDEKASV